MYKTSCLGTETIRSILTTVGFGPCDVKSVNEGARMPTSNCRTLQRFIFLGLAVILAEFPTISFARQAEKELPVVIAASVPLYPRTPLIAHIFGTVRIRVTTDGSAVSSMNSESGPPMLVKAAKENIQTWQFEKHKPTTFFVTFQYRLEDTATCRFENGTVTLHLPSQVEISAPGIQTCDPVATVGVRVESIVSESLASFGYVILLTNDSAYWCDSKNSAGTSDAFSLRDGRTICGQLDWSATASAGTKRKREQAIRVAAQYVLQWQNYSRVAVRSYPDFRYLALKAASPAASL